MLRWQAPHAYQTCHLFWRANGRGCSGRTATVDVPEDKDAEVVEINWGITEQDHELLDRFIELLLKNTTNKLKAGYIVSARMWKGARELSSSYKKRAEELETENKKLRL